MRLVLLVLLVACVEDGSRALGEFCAADADCGSALAGVVCSGDGEGICRWPDQSRVLGDPCVSDADCADPMVCEAPGLRDAPGLCCAVVGHPDYVGLVGDPEDDCGAPDTGLEG